MGEKSYYKSNLNLLMSKIKIIHQLLDRQKTNGETFNKRIFMNNILNYGERKNRSCRKK